LQSKAIKTKKMFEKICSFENLYLAYRKARKCKRYRSEILEFSFGLEANLIALQNDLINQTYHHGGYREFIVNDSKNGAFRLHRFATGWFTTLCAISLNRFLTRLLFLTATLAARIRERTRRLKD